MATNAKGNIKGLDVLAMVNISATSTPKWEKIEEQVSTTFGGSAETADTTSKSNEGWSTSIATTRSAEVSCEGNYIEGSTVLNKVEEAWATGNEVHLRLYKDKNQNGYEALFSVTSFEISGDATDVAKYSISFAPIGAVSIVTSGSVAGSSSSSGSTTTSGS